MIGVLVALATAAAAPIVAAPPDPPQWIVVAKVRTGRWSGWYYDYCRKDWYEMGSAEDRATVGPDDCLTHGGEAFKVRLDVVEVIHGPPGASPPRQVVVLGHAIDWRHPIWHDRRVFVLSPIRSGRLRKATGLELLADSWNGVGEYACVGKLTDAPGPNDTPLEPLSNGCYDLDNLRRHYSEPEPETTAEQP